MQRAEQDVAAPLQLLGQRLVHPTDLRLPGEEHQHAAALVLQRLQHRLHHPRLDALARRQRAAPALLHRVHAPLAAHHRCLVEQRRQALALQRRRHQQELERLVAQQLTRIERQRQGQIGIQAALVEFVEDHQPDAFQCRVVLQAARKDALGDHLDAGVRPDLAVQADAVAHRLADPLAQLAGQAFGGGAGGQPARFEHDDGLPGQPGFAEQRQRHAGGLAGAGRRLEHGFVALLQGLAQRRQNFVDR